MTVPGPPLPKVHRPVTREGLSTRISRELRTSILDRTYEPGDVLPPERELAVQFGVDRHTCRAALQELEQLGLVSRRQGSGWRVNDYRQSASLALLKHLIVRPGSNELDAAVVASALDVVRVMFHGTAALVVQRADPEDLAKIVEAIDALEATMDLLDADMLIAADREVVHRFFRAAHSIAAELTLNTLYQVFDAGLDPSGTLHESWAELIRTGAVCRTYRQLAEAIRRRDAATALAATDEIITHMAVLAAAQHPTADPPR